MFGSWYTTLLSNRKISSPSVSICPLPLYSNLSHSSALVSLCPSFVTLLTFHSLRFCQSSLLILCLTAALCLIPAIPFLSLPLSFSPPDEQVKRKNGQTVLLAHSFICSLSLSLSVCAATSVCSPEQRDAPRHSDTHTQTHQQCAKVGHWALRSPILRMWAEGWNAERLNPWHSGDTPLLQYVDALVTRCPRQHDRVVDSSMSVTLYYFTSCLWLSGLQCVSSRCQVLGLSVTRAILSFISSQCDCVTGLLLFVGIVIHMILLIRMPLSILLIIDSLIPD